MFFSFFLLSVYKRLLNDFSMVDDSELKSTLNNILLHAVGRMESSTDVKTRRCIFQEYKEWLGKSIDDWVLALPDDWGKSDANFH